MFVTENQHSWDIIYKGVCLGVGYPRNLPVGLSFCWLCIYIHKVSPLNPHLYAAKSQYFFHLCCTKNDPHYPQILQDIPLTSIFFGDFASRDLPDLPESISLRHCRVRDSLPAFAVASLVVASHNLKSPQWRGQKEWLHRILKKNNQVISGSLT